MIPKAEARYGKGIRTQGQYVYISTQIDLNSNLKRPTPKFLMSENLKP